MKKISVIQSKSYKINSNLIKNIPIDIWLICFYLLTYLELFFIPKPFVLLFGIIVFSLYLFVLLFFSKLNLFYKPTYAHWLLIAGVSLGFEVIWYKLIGTEPFFLSFITGAMFYHLACICAYQKVVIFPTYGTHSMKNNPVAFYIAFIIVAIFGVGSLLSAIVYDYNLFLNILKYNQNVN